jgi:four helix bundle protein
MPSTFEDLVVFQRAVDLMVHVYRITDSFPRHELYGLTSQIRRAAVSIASNIAEAQGRLTFGESRQLLSQARGSLYEVDAQLIAALRLGYVSSGERDDLRTQVVNVARPLAGLIEHIRRRERQAHNKRTIPVFRRPSTRKNRGESS